VLEAEKMGEHIDIDGYLVSQIVSQIMPKQQVLWSVPSLQWLVPTKIGWITRETSVGVMGTQGLWLRNLILPTKEGV